MARECISTTIPGKQNWALAEMASTVQRCLLIPTIACASATLRNSSRFSCYGKNGGSLRMSEVAHNLTSGGTVDSVDGGSCHSRGSQIVVRGRRSALYGDAETYVLMEPGEDEQFVTAEELQEKLKGWLQEWPGEELPMDMSRFNNVDEAVLFLVNAVCELDLGDGQGSLQWFEVRLE